jgi:hypothetical protein
MLPANRTRKTFPACSRLFGNGILTIGIALMTTVIVIFPIGNVTMPIVFATMTIGIAIFPFVIVTMLAVIVIFPIVIAIFPIGNVTIPIVIVALTIGKMANLGVKTSKIAIFTPDAAPMGLKIILIRVLQRCRA